MRDVPAAVEPADSTGGMIGANLGPWRRSIGCKCCEHRSVLQNAPREIIMGQAKQIRIAAILSAMIWAVFPTMVHAAGTILVGNPTIYSSVDSNTAGHAEAFRATASASGTIAT